MFRFSIFPLLLPLTLALPSPAQTGVVLPASATLPPEAGGAGFHIHMFGGTPAFPGAPNEYHTQVMYDVGAIGLPSSAMTSLEVRPPAIDPPIFTTGGSMQLTIQMSVSPMPSSSMSRTFAANRGPAPTTVFSGTVSWPSGSGPVSWPGAWQPVATFTTPFPYTPIAGGSLVVECWASGNTAQQPWTIEEYRVADGDSRSVFQHSIWPLPVCLSSANVRAGSGWAGVQCVPGQSWNILYGSYPNQVPSLAVNALFFGFRGPGAAFGGFTLPVPISSFGLTSPFGCELAIEPVVGVPMQYLSVGSPGGLNSSLWIPGFNMPNDPGLVNTSFFTQAVAVDTIAGSPSLISSSAVEWTFGSGVGPAASYITRVGDNTNAVAQFVVDDACPVLRIGL